MYPHSQEAAQALLAGAARKRSNRAAGPRQINRPALVRGKARKLLAIETCFNYEADLRMGMGA